MQPLLLGKIPSGRGTADVFVTIAGNDGPLMRVDLYREPGSPCFQQDALAWGECIFVGFGEAVFVIDPRRKAGSRVELESYFDRFYSTPDYLLVTSGVGISRLSPTGEVLWSSQRLALDGVIVSSVNDGIIFGDGEWDPPSSWRPFRVLLDSGALVG